MLLVIIIWLPAVAAGPRDFGAWDWDWAHLR
jgi:hypothetical protein